MMLIMHYIHFVSLPLSDLTTLFLPDILITTFKHLGGKYVIYQLL